MKCWNAAAAGCRDKWRECTVDGVYWWRVDEQTAPVKVDYTKWPPHRAASQKWAEGQKVHGPVFQGDALAHLYEEQLDSMNYVSELEVEGLSPLVVESWRRLVTEMASRVWMAIQARANEPSVAPPTAAGWVNAGPSPTEKKKDARKEPPFVWEPAAHYVCCAETCLRESGDIAEGRHRNYGHGHYYHEGCPFNWGAWTVGAETEGGYGGSDLLPPPGLREPDEDPYF